MDEAAKFARRRVGEHVNSRREATPQQKTAPEAIERGMGRSTLSALLGLGELDRAFRPECQLYD